MDISRTFNFMQQDKDWVVKLLIVGLISLIPVIGPLYLAGWMMEISKRTELGRENMLPDVDFATYIKYGLKYWVVNLIYSIPIFLVSMSVSFCSSVLLTSDNAFLNFVGFIFVLLLSVLNMLLAVAIYGLTYASYIRVMNNGTIQSGLDFEIIFTMVRENFREFLILIGMGIVYGFVASLGFIVCCVGILFTAPFTSAAIANLIGQLSTKICNGPVSQSKPVAAAKPSEPVQPVQVTVPAEGEIGPDRGTILDRAVDTIEDAVEPTANVIEETVEKAVEPIADEIKEAADDALNSVSDVREFLDEETDTEPTEE